MTRSPASRLAKMAGLVPAIACKGSGHRALVLAALGFLLLSASVSLGQQLQASRIEWIDVHVHLIGGPLPGRASGEADYAGAVYAAVTAMDEAGIRKSVVLPPPRVWGTPGVYDYEHFAAALKRYPGRFAFLGGGGSLNPMIQDTGTDPEAVARARGRFEGRAEEIVRAGAAGFGEISAHHLSLMPAHPYESVPADHPLLLLLADIAARHGVVIDLHFDPVTEDTAPSGRLAAARNPPVLRANVAAFERFLAHNRKVKIVWAHVGSDPLGHWTVSLSRELLGKHPNLYMSIRMGGGVPRNQLIDAAGEVRPEWLKLLQDFPDRFVIGGDQFIPSPQVGGSGPGMMFARMAPVVRERTRTLLSRLATDLARKIGLENATRLYKLDP